MHISPVCVIFHLFLTRISPFPVMCLLVLSFSLLPVASLSSKCFLSVFSFLPSPNFLLLHFAVNLLLTQAASCGIYSSTELQDAQTTADLPLRNSSKDAIFVNVDHRSMGVGGDNSWYPDIVHAEYTVSARNPYRFRVRMVALTPGESGPLVALRQAS